MTSSVVRACITSLVLLALATGCARQQTDVLLIVIDTLRADHLAIYGYERETAPNLSRLAKDAVVYERATSPGTWTVPSHGSILTGKWPSFHGAERVVGDRILAMPVNPQFPMLTEILREHGYRTGAFLGNSTYVARVFGFDRGFGSFRTGDFWHSEAVVGPVTDWLRESADRSFLLWNVIDPHEPYDPPAPFDTMFPGRRPEFGVMLSELVQKGASLTTEVIGHFVSQYDGEIAVADLAIGKVLDALRQQDRYRSALIIVTSDHGEMFGEHGMIGHGTPPLEPMVHVPLIVKYPQNRRAGERVVRRVSTAAIFATVLQTLGIPPPSEDIVPALDDPHDVWVEDLDHTGVRVRAGYQGNHKLVTRRRNGTAQSLLYDLAKDPGENSPAPGTTNPQLKALEQSFANLPRPANLANVPVIDADHEAKLRALGYVR